MARKMKSYPSARAVAVLCSNGAFCGKRCTGRETCEHINPQYDPDWEPEDLMPAIIADDPLTDAEWAALIEGWTD